MHSHSGQFCPGHAKDQLEDIVKHAISIGYKTMGLTEHMPRTELADLYPEEVSPPPLPPPLSKISFMVNDPGSSSRTRTRPSPRSPRGPRPSSPRRGVCRPSTPGRCTS